ncbi:MAG: penicillin-binding protein 2 [Armatimonadota bacterium]|nr:penicillin-binding protein 2 [Armatimonadota bacterium]
MKGTTKHGRPRSEEGSAGFWIPAIFLAFAFAAVVANQFRVQWFGRGAILARAAEVDRLWAEDVVRARRGDIFDANLRLLAESVDAVVLGIDGRTKGPPDNPAFWAELGAAAGVSGAELRDYAMRKGAPNDFDFILTRHQAKRVGAVRSRYGANGVWTRPVETREYPLGRYTAPIIGFLDSSGAGQTGLEKSFSEQLKGTPGEKKGITDDDGHFLPWLNQEEREAIAGKDVQLTIDADLQISVMNALAAACEKHGATRGSAIVLEPKTGDVLALATWPTYDPDKIAEAKRDAGAGGGVSPEVNPAIELRFEPGSTFKVFTLALGLETGAIEANTTMQCAGTKSFDGTPMSCAGDHGGRAHGTVSPAKCMEVSCNLAAATWAVKMGFKTYTDMIRDLGLLAPQNVGLPNENRTRIDWEDFNKTIQTANLGFGQAMGTTPIGLASAFTVFGNDGVRSIPRLVKSINGKEQPVRHGKRVFSAKTSREVLHMMDAVIQGDRGTGKRMRINGYRLAGKTGTAQKIGSSPLPGSQYVSNFVGYVPAKNPRAVVLVMIDEPQKGGYYGGVVAGPVFQETARQLIRKFRISPSEGGAVAPH